MGLDSSPDTPEKLDESYIERGLFAIWRMDLVEYIKIKAALAKQFHIQPSELENMPFWEYEIFIKQINALVKDENDQQKAQMDKYHVDEYMDMARPKNMQKMMSGMQPKTPG